MAGRRKQPRTPNQFSLFDITPGMAEQIREENIRADLAEAEQEQAAPVTQAESVAQPSGEAAPPKLPCPLRHNVRMIIRADPLLCPLPRQKPDVEQRRYRQSPEVGHQTHFGCSPRN